MTAPHQVLSPSGHCRPFDHRSDGIVPSDAVCSLVLRRLEDAVKDGDSIYSIISGIAIGSDGATNKASLSAPSSRGQTEVMKRAWNAASVPTGSLRYVE